MRRRWSSTSAARSSRRTGPSRSACSCCARRRRSTRRWAGASWTAARANEILARAGGLLSQARALDFQDQLPSLGSAQLSLAKVPRSVPKAMENGRLSALRS